MSTMAMSGLFGHSDPRTTLAADLYRRTAEGAMVEAGEATHRAAAARRPLLWVAAAHTAGTAVLVLADLQPLLDHDPRVQLIAAASLGVTAAFWAVWAWAAIAPLPAALVGLTSYAALVAAGWSSAPALPAALSSAEATGQTVGFAQAAAWVGTTLGLLVRSIVAGIAARRALDRAERITADRSGVLPSLALYAAMLGVLVVARMVTADDDRYDAVEHSLLTMRVMALVVVAAAILGWRTVLPAVARVGSASWLVAAVLFGLATFAWSSIYADCASAALGLPRAGGYEPIVAVGYGWAGAVAAVALYPAVVEELAFRGLIVPRLGRVLTGGETVLVSAVMFAALHLNVTALPVLLPVGAALAVLRRRSGSLWPCLLMHLTHNAAVLAAERWM